jgi:hypothetical protein
VYFDELKITHVKSRVLQESHYYPFGLAMSTSWTRETAVNNNYLYNAGSELNDNTQLGSSVSLGPLMMEHYFSI